LLNFVHFIKHFKHTGAIAPSSGFLVREMIASLEEDRNSSDEPIRILELGPGTGVITKAIIKLMKPGDHLDIVELDTDFYTLVKKKFEGSDIEVHGLNVLDFDYGKPYDFILSSIPYDQMPSEVTRSIWLKKLEMIHLGGHISYYKYYKFNFIRCKFEWFVNRKFLQNEKLVVKNIPPAVIYSLKVTERLTAN
jgi:phosphatidylethanolamine/phosphatidyl-N-methylethanolamine N-methyltransferase